MHKRLGFSGIGEFLCEIAKFFHDKRANDGDNASLQNIPPSLAISVHVFSAIFTSVFGNKLERNYGETVCMSQTIVCL